MSAQDGRPLVSVVIAVKDRRALLDACLASLGRQTFTDFEVVVVDNGSTDGTRELLAERRRGPLSFELTVLDELGSLGRVRNVGVDAARGDILAFIDSDCTATPTWLERGTAPFRAEDGGRVGTVQGQTAPDPLLPRGSWDATQHLTSFTHRYEACNLLYRSELLRRAGGFDEAIGFFGEDTAAGWAVRRLGWEERFAADAVVHHTVTFPGIRWHWRRGRSYGNWNRLVRQYPEMRDILWHRWFLRPRSARALAALVGFGLLAAAAFAGRRGAPAGAALAAPFVWDHRPRAITRSGLRDAMGSAGLDLAVEVALARGSVRERCVVL